MEPERDSDIKNVLIIVFEKKTGNVGNTSQIPDRCRVREVGALDQETIDLNLVVHDLLLLLVEQLDSLLLLLNLVQLFLFQFLLDVGLLLVFLDLFDLVAVAESAPEQREAEKPSKLEGGRNLPRPDWHQEGKLLLLETDEEDAVLSINLALEQNFPVFTDAIFHGNTERFRKFGCGGENLEAEAALE